MMEKLPAAIRSGSALVSRAFAIVVVVSTNDRGRESNKEDLRRPLLVVPAGGSSVWRWVSQIRNPAHTAQTQSGITSDSPHSDIEGVLERGVRARRGVHTTTDIDFNRRKLTENTRSYGESVGGLILAL